MEDDVFTDRVRDMLFVIRHGEIIGCHRGATYYIAKEFTIEMKLEAANKKRHAKELRRRWDDS
jgi:hypothetical protein